MRGTELDASIPAGLGLDVILVRLSLAGDGSLELYLFGAALRAADSSTTADGELDMRNERGFVSK